MGDVGVLLARDEAAEGGLILGLPRWALDRLHFLAHLFAAVI